jgi:hypothetical protein
MIELFANYKQFVGKDTDGEITFDIKRFMSVSPKKYK